MWAAFLFFVAWLFADNVIYAATVEPTAMNVVLAILMAAGWWAQPWCSPSWRSLSRRIGPRTWG